MKRIGPWLPNPEPVADGEEQTRVFRVVRRDTTTHTTLVMAASPELALQDDASRVAASQVTTMSELVECVELVPDASQGGGA